MATGGRLERRPRKYWESAIRTTAALSPPKPEPTAEAANLPNATLILRDLPKPMHEEVVGFRESARPPPNFNL
jgi:hypothetical protein